MKTYKERKAKRLAKLKRQAILAALPTDRSCEGCTACCTTHGVVELKKPYFEPCKHQCATGCAIYSQRPPSCRDFYCQWRVGAVGGERPDTSGIVIDIGPVWDVAGEMRSAYGVFEVRPGALEAPANQEQVKRLAEKGVVLLFFFGKVDAIQYGSGHIVKWRFVEGLAPKVPLPLV
jgi:hypothetical protein